MGCRSDYMEANALEIEASRVALMLDEVTHNKPVDPETRFWDGYHKDYYNRNTTVEIVDEITSKLCFALSTVDDVTMYTLEVQTWWRNHQREDERRENEEAVEKFNEEIRKIALAKLTPEEKKVLGL